MTCSRSHSKDRLDSVLVCLDCQRDDAVLLKRLADALANVKRLAENSDALEGGMTNDGMLLAIACDAGTALASARAAGVIA